MGQLHLNPSLFSIQEVHWNSNCHQCSSMRKYWNWVYFQNWLELRWNCLSLTLSQYHHNIDPNNLQIRSEQSKGLDPKITKKTNVSKHVSASTANTSLALGQSHLSEDGMGKQHGGQLLAISYSRHSITETTTSISYWKPVTIYNTSGSDTQLYGNIPLSICIWWHFKLLFTLRVSQTYVVTP